MSDLVAHLKSELDGLQFRLALHQEELHAIGAPASDGDNEARMRAQADLDLCHHRETELTAVLRGKCLTCGQPIEAERIEILIGTCRSCADLEQEVISRRRNGSKLGKPKPKKEPKDF